MTYLVVYAHADNFERGASEAPEAELIRIKSNSVIDIRAASVAEHWKHQGTNSVVSILTPANEGKIRPVFCYNDPKELKATLSHIRAWFAPAPASPEVA